MQWDSVQPGPFHHEFACGILVLARAVEEGVVDCGGDSAGHRAEWVSDFCDWDAVRTRGSEYDQLAAAPEGRAGVFSAVADPVFWAVVVVEEGRGKRDVEALKRGSVEAWGRR